MTTSTISHSALCLLGQVASVPGPNLSDLRALRENEPAVFTAMIDGKYGLLEGGETLTVLPLAPASSVSAYVALGECKEYPYLARRSSSRTFSLRM